MLLPYVGAMAILFGTAYAIDKTWAGLNFMWWLENPKK
jgi:hypothetical protein